MELYAAGLLKPKMDLGLYLWRMVKNGGRVDVDQMASGIQRCRFRMKWGFNNTRDPIAAGFSREVQCLSGTGYQRINGVENRRDTQIMS